MGKYLAVSTRRPSNPESIAKKHLFRKRAHSRTEGFRRYRSLVWMILSWLSGMVLAIGHHLFYAGINGARVNETYPSQIWIVRIATGLAFLVKTLFVISATIAYTQYQWLTTRSQPFKIRQIDALSSILANPLRFCETRTWLRFPALSLLAGITWSVKRNPFLKSDFLMLFVRRLLPLAAIITPAAIIVSPHQETRNFSTTPRQLYFDPTQYADMETFQITSYVGPSSHSLRAAFGSAMTGQQLVIPVAYSNMSYTLGFLGPALRCDPAEASFVHEVYEAYLEKLADPIIQYRYMAWVPVDTGRVNLTNSEQTLDLVSTDTAHLYIIPNTSIAGPMFIDEQNSPGDSRYGYQDLLDCKLYNASYQAVFNFSYPSQTIDIRSRTLLNPVNVSRDISDWYFSDKGAADVVQMQAQRICYQSIMESLGRLLVGYQWWSDGYKITDRGNWATTTINWTSRDTAQQGVEEMFQNITLSMLSSPYLT